MEAHLVVFRLTNEHYGIDIQRVQSIIPMPAITVVPGVPRFIEGIINLRGALVPVVDLRARLELTAPAEMQKRVIVIVEIDGQQIGIIVDKVTEVRKVPGEAIKPPSAFLSSVDTAYLRGIAKVDERLIILLDLDRVFAPHEQLALRQAA